MGSRPGSWQGKRSGSNEGPGGQARAMTKSILITAAGSGPSNNLMRSVMKGLPGTVLVGCHCDRFLLKKSPAQRNFLTPMLDAARGCEALLQILAEADINLVMP